MHNHKQPPSTNIALAVVLNVSFTILEIIGGLWTNSLAILSDALHDLGDSIVLISALVLEKKSRAPADARRTFGYRRLSLLSAFISAAVLIGGSLFILSQAIPRLMQPEHVYAPGMIGLALIGLLFNGIGYYRLKRGASMNEKVLSWHLLDDVLGWSVILIGSLVIQVWDTHILDPLMTLGFTAFTLWGVYKTVREMYNIFMQGVPDHIDASRVTSALCAVPGVLSVHDLHIWSLEGETDIFTGHVVVTDEAHRQPDTITHTLRTVLREHHIEHSTIELERAETCSGDDCTHEHARES